MVELGKLNRDETDASFFGIVLNTLFTISGAVTHAGSVIANTPVICGSSIGPRQTLTDSNGAFTFLVGSNEAMWTISCPSVSPNAVAIGPLSVDDIAGLRSATYANANLLL